jgi:hypothetical protein
MKAARRTGLPTCVTLAIVMLVGSVAHAHELGVALGPVYDGGDGYALAVHFGFTPMPADVSRGYQFDVLFRIAEIYYPGSDQTYYLDGQNIWRVNSVPSYRYWSLPVSLRLAQAGSRIAPYLELGTGPLVETRSRRIHMTIGEQTPSSVDVSQGQVRWGMTGRFAAGARIRLVPSCQMFVQSSIEPYVLWQGDREPDTGYWILFQAGASITW